MRCRLIIFALLAALCAQRVDARPTSVLSWPSRFTDDLRPSTVLAGTAGRDFALGTAVACCCHEGQLGCQIKMKGVTRVELCPTYDGVPQVARGTPSGNTSHFGRLQLDDNDIIWTIDTSAIIVPTEFDQKNSSSDPIKIKYRFDVHDLYRFDQP